MDIVLYLHAHQPYRVRDYNIFDAGQYSDYFDSHERSKSDNRDILNKVSEKSYLPTNKLLLHLLEAYPEFRLSLSITGTLLEQLEQWRPDVLESFQKLTATGRVEIVGETYHHSLAFFHDRQEFERQVQMHSDICERLLNYKPHSFRNTELAYNNELGKWCEDNGYEAVLSEGWDPILGWRSPNHVYRPPNTSNIALLTKNYRLSDDIAFRFGNKGWESWPLDADTFVHWIQEGQKDAEVINLFMDFETFGEHQWSETGIFEFLANLPHKWLRGSDYGFRTVSGAARNYERRDTLDMHNTVTWADTERDLTAWTGNAMQTESLRAIYDLGDKVLASQDMGLINDWRKLQTSDHFYYMCTKWWNDGDVHAYFSAYDSPYEAQMNYMNAVLDMKTRLAKKGLL